MTHLLSHLIHSAPHSHSFGGNKLTAKGREVLKDAVAYNKEAADELLFSEAALRGKEGGAPPGRLELRRRSSGGALVRWRPDKGGASSEIDVAAIKEIQNSNPSPSPSPNPNPNPNPNPSPSPNPNQEIQNSKREKRMAMIRLTMKGGPPPPPGHIFNFLVGDGGAFDANFEVAPARVRVRVRVRVSVTAG